MRRNPVHALPVRDALPPVPVERDHPGEPARSVPAPFPAAGAVLSEAMATVAVFLLIALALHLLAVRMGA